MITVPEKRMVTEYVTETSQVPYTYTEMVYTPVEETRMVTTYTCQPKTITETIPVCRKVMVPCAPACAPVSRCGGCAMACGRPTRASTSPNSRRFAGP